MATVKRGRGRPRRKPLPPEELSSVMVLDGNNAVPLLVWLRKVLVQCVFIFKINILCT